MANCKGGDKLHQHPPTPNSWVKPDYVKGIVRKCVAPMTSKGPMKDDCKIFWT